MSAVQSLKQWRTAREQESFESPSTTAVTVRTLLDDDNDEHDSGFCPFERLETTLKRREKLRSTVSR